MNTAMNLEKHHQRMQLLADVTYKIRQSLDLHEILQTTVTEVRQLLNADRVLMFQIHPDGQGTVVQEAVLPGWSPCLDQILSIIVLARPLLILTAKAGYP
ncbi:MAG: GAF domain-containing protein [Acaryochloridaceae cyanobacterium SU_2_1]|nr:GAF domain-containing protein [Acaryochloridaceae cyanobacterium SU_2_1]